MDLEDKRVKINVKSYTASKVSKFGVFVVRIHTKYGKIRTRNTPNRDTFLTVLSKCYSKKSELRFFASLNPARIAWKVSDGRNLY